MKDRIFYPLMLMMAFHYLHLNSGEAKTISKTQVEQPGVVQAVAPEYPLIAATKRIEGEVVVEVEINGQGKVISASAVSGHKLLQGMAIKIAQRWVFTLIEEKSETKKLNLVFDFKIMPENTKSEDLLPIFKPPYRVEIRGTVPQFVFTPSIDPPSHKYPQRSKRKKTKLNMRFRKVI